MAHQSISGLHSFDPVTPQSDKMVSRTEPPAQDASTSTTSAAGADIQARVESQPYPAEMALTLVLHEIVEHARSVTSATGATLVLACGSENRFHAGATASDVDSYLQKSSGLLDTFLRTGAVFRSDDTEKDPQIDANASRRLGVRSLVIVPARRTAGDLVGFIQAFSSRPSAFGDHEIQWLLALARRIVHNLELVEQNSVGSPVVSGHNSGRFLPRASLASSMWRLPRVAKGRALYGMILAVALLVIFLIGYGLSGIRQKQISVIKQESSGSLVREQSLPQASGTTIELSGSVPEQKDEPVTAADSAAGASPTTAVPPSRSSGSRTKTRPALGAEGDRAASGKTVPSDGLTLFENRKAFSGVGAPRQSTPRGLPDSRPDNLPSMAGIKISRMPLPRTQDSSRPLVVTEQAALANLIERVEPKAPRSGQFKSGPVKIDAVVDENGAVTSVKPVSGDPQLILAAAHALRHWRFKPLMQEGQPLKFESQFTIQFTQ